MAVTKYLVQALALAATAYADCKSDEATTIVNPAGASAIATCTKYEGDIVLETGVASLQNTVNLGDKLEEIDGKLTYANDNQVHTISAPSLSKIGELSLTNLSALADLGLSGLKEVGNMELTGLSVLGSLGFGGSLSKAGVVTIINTQIQDLTGIDTISEITSLTVSDNPFLSKIGLSVRKIQMINIGPNDVSNGGQTASLPNLRTADFLVFRNMTSVQVPSLANVSQNLELHGNVFESFAAPNLTKTGGFVCNDNLELTNISLPLLKSVAGENGTLQIANNTKLDKINFMPNLEEVKQDIDLSGSFDEVVFGKLKRVGGAFHVDTSAEKFDCPAIEGLEGETVLGDVTCHFNDPTPERGGNGDDGDSGSSSDTPGAGVSVNAPLFLSGATVVASVLSMLFL